MNETTSPVVSASAEDRNWALAAHLSTFSFFFSGIGMVLGPLIIWLVKRDQSAFVAQHAREALNFNITVALAFVLLLVFTLGTFGIGIVLAWPAALALFIAWIAFPIIAAVRASEGREYRYPFTLRLIN